MGLLMNFPAKTSRKEECSLRQKTPSPVGSEVAISLPMEAGSHIHLRGIVMSAKLPSANTPGHPVGMGIEFKEVRDEELTILRDFVREHQLKTSLRSQKS